MPDKTWRGRNLKQICPLEVRGKGVRSFRQALRHPYEIASQLHEAVRHLPQGSFVLETDSPYLAPHPYRGRRNESSYLSIIARAIAELRGTSVEAIWDETNATAWKVFKPL